MDNSTKTQKNDVALISKKSDADMSKIQTASVSNEIIEKLKPYFDKMQYELKNKSDFNEKRMRDFITEIVNEVYCKNNIASDEAPKKVYNAQMERIATEADIFIKENLLNPLLSVSFVADNLYISTSYLYRCAIQCFGMSVSEYISSCKLERACELIIEGRLSLVDIAHSLNYCSQSYFSFCFKQKYGISPMRFKAKYCISK